MHKLLILDKMLAFNRSLEITASLIAASSMPKAKALTQLDTQLDISSKVPPTIPSEPAESTEANSTEHADNRASHNLLMDQVEAEIEKPRSFKEIMEQKRLLAKIKAEAFTEENLAPIAEIIQAPTHFETASYHPNEIDLIEEAKTGKQESFSLNIVLNQKQLAAKEMAFNGKSFNLIGAAGTGKTTAQREIAEALLLDNRLSISKFKTYNKESGAREYKTAPSIAFVAYTRRAAANLAKAIYKSPVLAETLQNNIMTIHALLEYEPETYYDNDEQKEKFRFAPKRHASNPLDITHLVIEEASMLGVSDLWPKLYDALPCGVQIIFIGDINQLPPVFGPSILNYSLVQLPIIELTEVYRNQGIVLENAHNILEGKDIVETENYKIVRGNKPVQEGQVVMSEKLGFLFKHMYNNYDDNGNKLYDPEDCIILIPFNKQPLGSINMNKWIAQFLGESRNAEVHEVIAGFAKHYLAVGDKIMYNKVDGVITNISRNPQYFGREPQTPGPDLSRFGHRIMGVANDYDPFEDSIDYAEFSLEKLEEEKIERKQQASHTITITYSDDRTDTISSAGDLSDAVFSLGYCLSVHKSQGSEWRKVFIIMHRDHSTMLYRELFYTAATRARTEVCIIAKDPSIRKAIATQRIKGQKLSDKLEYFNSGQLKYADVVCVK